MKLKIWVLAVSLLAAFTLPSLSFAFECTSRIKDAETALKAAQGVTPSLAAKKDVEKKIEDAGELIAQAKREHKEGKRNPRLHASAARKAKIARAYAEEAPLLAKRVK